MGIPHYDSFDPPRQVGSVAVYAYGPFVIRKEGDLWRVDYAGRDEFVQPQTSLEKAVAGAKMLAMVFESKYIDAGSTWRRLVVPFRKPGTTDRRRLVEASTMFFPSTADAHGGPELLKLLSLGYAVGRLQHDKALTHTMEDGHTYRLEVFPASGVIREMRNPKFGAVFIPTISRQPGDGMYHDTYRITRVARPNRNHLPGGRGAHLNPRDFDPRALAIGTKHELEHTSDRDIAQEIAMDHLAEYPHYYDMLGELERTYPQRYPQDVLRRSNRESSSPPLTLVEFPREIAEQVRSLRADLWRKHGTGGNPPTAWTGDDAYNAWGWWIDLREGRAPPADDLDIAADAYVKLTGSEWDAGADDINPEIDPDVALFTEVVRLWLNKRRNYVSRHRGDFRPGGTISMIKWAAVSPHAVEEHGAAQGYKAMLSTLGLAVDSQGKVKRKN